MASNVVLLLLATFLFVTTTNVSSYDDEENPLLPKVFSRQFSSKVVKTPKAPTSPKAPSWKRPPRTPSSPYLKASPESKNPPPEPPGKIDCRSPCEESCSHLNLPNNGSACVSHCLICCDKCKCGPAHTDENEEKRNCIKCYTDMIPSCPVGV